VIVRVIVRGGTNAVSFLPTPHCLLPRARFAVRPNEIVISRSRRSAPSSFRGRAERDIDLPPSLLSSSPSERAAPARLRRKFVSRSLRSPPELIH